MGVEIEGLDELQNQLEQLANFGDGIPMTELFDEEFMLMYTEFASFDKLLEEGKWDVESQEDFEAIPQDEFDEYIDTNTEFPDWETMMQTGATRHIEEKLS